jgi:siroheme synthase-like protein
MPISVSMPGRKCLVVGGGPVAVRKVANLLEYDSRVTVVAPEVHEVLEQLAEQGRITLERREYVAPEAGEYGLAIAATDNRALNQRVYDDATAKNVLVNVVDDVPLCDFIVPSVVRRDCLTVAVTTDGKAPFMAGHLRLILEDVFPEHWRRLMRYAVEFRANVRNRWPEDEAKRRACYAQFLEADWKVMIAEMDESGIEAALSGILERPAVEGAR